jgi:hypothetical protein
VRKTYPLHVEGKHPDRVLDAIKHDIRKYIKRERRRELPAGVDFWDFDCTFGNAETDAKPVHLNDIIGLIDGVVQAQGSQFYVSIVAKHGHRAARPVNSTDAAADETDGEEPQ